MSMTKVAGSGTAVFAIAPAAARRLAEMGSPGGILCCADRAASRVVRQYMRRAGIFAVQDVIAGVDCAAVIVVTRYSSARHAEHTGCVELRRVPSQARAKALAS